MRMVGEEGWVDEKESCWKVESVSGGEKRGGAGCWWWWWYGGRGVGGRTGAD